jgi:rhodanese-related sulfurtransferase
MKQITAPALAARLKDPGRGKPLLLDVREPWEFQICRIDGSRHVPMGEIPARAAELDSGAEVVVICHHGARSLQVALFLEKQGFSDVTNLTGGVDAWAKNVDPAMPVY